MSLWQNSALMDEARQAIEQPQRPGDAAEAVPPIEWPSAFVPYTLQRYTSGLTTSADVAERQDAEERQADATSQRSSLAGLTLRTAGEDMYAALTGIPADLYERRGRVGLEIFTREDRLRGLGLWLIVLSLLALLVL